jgi:DNA-binding transcriptional ArsR family regulator
LRPRNGLQSDPARSRGETHPGADRPAESQRLVFITSHARVLLTLAQNPEIRVREVAKAACLTRRSVYRILTELVDAGYVRRVRIGRRNHYELDPDQPLGDPVSGELTLRDLVSVAEGESHHGPSEN